MNTMEFQTQVSRLRTQFGEKAFSDEKTKLLWKKFAFVDSRSFEQVVDHLIMNSRVQPTLDDFFNAIDASKSRYSSPGTRCDKCENSGWCALWECENGQVIAERCDCCGGPDQLARSIENHPGSPDRDLADRIRASFSPEAKTRMHRLTKSEIQKLQERQAMNAPN